MSALRTETDEEIEAKSATALTNRNRQAYFNSNSISRGTGLNVVLHQRDAWRRPLKSCGLTRETARRFHCFGGSIDEANEFFDLDHLVSFTGIVTFKNGVTVREVAAQIPLLEIHGGNRLPLSGACPFSRKTL